MTASTVEAMATIRPCVSIGVSSGDWVWASSMTGRPNDYWAANSSAGMKALEDLPSYSEVKSRNESQNNCVSSLDLKVMGSGHGIRKLGAKSTHKSGSPSNSMMSWKGKLAMRRSPWSPKAWALEQNLPLCTNTCDAETHSPHGEIRTTVPQHCLSK